MSVNDFTFGIKSKSGLFSHTANPCGGNPGATLIFCPTFAEMSHGRDGKALHSDGIL